MAIQPIETRYAGCLFRSRTEARWAVFFDALGVEWEYEKEGYPLKPGWYLPDFFLPQMNAWFEVKGTRPTNDEITKAGFLCSETAKTVLIAEGSPIHRPKVWMFPYQMTVAETARGSGDMEPRHYFSSDDSGVKLVSDLPDITRFGPFVSASRGQMAYAYEAARSARFETRP